MKTRKKQKVLVINIIMFLIGTFFIPLSFGETQYSTEPVVITVNQYGENIEIIYEINDYSESYIMIDGVQYSIVSIGEESNLLQKGKPDIPNICRSVIIPDTANMEVNVLKTTYKDYDNVIIAPSKGNLLRSVNPDDISYEFNDIYNKDAWFPKEIASLREPYLLRDYRAQVVEIYPIQYNPVKKIMRVYSNIRIEIIQNGENTINCIYRENLPTIVDTDFKKIYENHFINFEKLGRYDPVGEQGNLLIISYDDFIDEMQPFVEWKIMKGIPTEIKKVSEIGNADDIKTYITNYYNDYGLTFVLLVGDEAQVPTLTASTYASDPSYSYVVGDDSYPDLFVGRFSAQNEDQVNTQVERSIEYEKTPQENADWYHNGTGIGSSSAQPGDDGERDYEHLRNIRNNKLYPYTYNWVDELYDETQGGDDAEGNPTPGMVSDAINDGRSVVNYCGHGSSYSWGTSGFNINNINNLANNNMLPYVICVACYNGQFDNYYECFCEAWLRATNNGEPAGAIAATGSSKSMEWSPPMDAQDEMMDIMVESYTDNIRHTIGGIHYNGVMHMNDEYGSSGYNETDAWHVFGDPSLQIRTDTPVGISVTRDNEIKEAVSYEVTVNGIEGALCAISRNNELIGYAYTDETGYALIEFDKPMIGNDPCNIVVTAYNKIPYIDILPVNISKPPQVPDKPIGPNTGKPKEELTFSVNTTDPEGDQVYYMWRWGDGDYSEWLGPFNSGEVTEASHSWDSPSNYQVRVKAKDTFYQETDWSESFIVSITKTKTKNLFFYSLFEYLQDTFPIITRFIKLL